MKNVVSAMLCLLIGLNPLYDNDSLSSSLYGVFGKISAEKDDGANLTHMPRRMGADKLGVLSAQTLLNETELGAQDQFVAAQYLYKERQKACPEGSVVLRCMIEIIGGFRAPECRIDENFEFDMSVVDVIKESTNQVANTMTTIGRCPGEEAGPGLSLTLEDLAVLKVKPSPVHTFPEIGVENPRVINLPVVVYTDSGVQMFTPTLLGQTVSVRVAPVSYTFDWGDGTVLGPVASPGSADVESDYQHTYTTLDPVRISVTTQWSASWSVDGASWRRVPGFLETTGTSPQLPIVEKVPLLVPDN